MALVIQTNNAAITAQKNINTNSATQNQALNRLSSGFRINSAADDAAGFAISSKLDAQGTRLKAAVQNASQASALVKTAEAGVNEIQNMVVRLQTLAVQAASANNAGSLTELDAERAKLTSEIDKIANATNFNGTNLLNGVDSTASTSGVASTGQSQANNTNTGFSAVTGTTGIYENATFSITTTAGAAATAGSLSGAAANGDLSTGFALDSTSTKNAVANGTYFYELTNTATNAGTLSVYSGTDNTGALLGSKAVTDAQSSTLTLANGVVFGYTTDASLGQATTDTFTLSGASAATLGTVTSVKSTADLKNVNGNTIVAAGSELLAATQNRVDAGALTLTLKALTGETGGTITVTDAAIGSAQKAGVSNVTTSGSTAGSSVDYTGALSFQVGGENNSNDQVTVNLQNKYTTSGLGITGDVSSAANALTYIDTLKTALATLITQRADLGAASNQLGFVTANLATSIEQVAASVSAIRDADIAAEMADFTKSQILVQAGTAMLAQANQSSQNVLRLFQ